MSRLLADENVPLAVVEALRSQGHDVATLADSLLGAGVSDAEVLAMARRTARGRDPEPPRLLPAAPRAT